MKASAHYARKRPPPVLVLAILSRSDMSRVTETAWIVVYVATGMLAHR